MGKPTGFLEYNRETAKAQDPKSRIRHFDEFHEHLPMEKQRLQGARCMDCGVPFCQSGMTLAGMTSGCPLHNLVPEWNELVYMGNWQEAYSRLHKTNNFPEFTSRVCPALCEKACTCSLDGEAVSTRENEYAIIENAYRKGYAAANLPKVRTGKKVAVVGSGPSGLTVADQLNRRGHLVTVFERSDRVGGLLMYGIPNMKLPKDVVQRRIELMVDEGVSFVTGLDASVPAVAQRLLADYDAVILCCGAERSRVLDVNMEGISSGIYYGTEFLKAAVERQHFGKTPVVPTAEGRDVVIIGTGDTASDCVATVLRQGGKSVTQLVRRPEKDYLRNGVLPADYAHQEAQAVTGRDPRRFGVQVKELLAENGVLTAVITTDGDVLPCGLLIAATGFAGCAEEVCRAFGVEHDKTVRTAEGGFATSVEKVFAAGDMRRGQSLVVWAIAEGRTVAAEVDEYLMGYTPLVRNI